MPEIKDNNLNSPSDKFSRHVIDLFTKSNAMVSVVVVLLGFLVGTIIIIAVGRNPAGMYSALLQNLTGFSIHPRTGVWVWNPRNIGSGLPHPCP